MFAQLNIEECVKDKLWKILVDTVHANVMYPTHKSYTRDVLLLEKPDLSAEQLSSKLNLPVGEAIVILYELTGESKSPQ